MSFNTVYSNSKIMTSLKLAYNFLWKSIFFRNKADKSASNSSESLILWGTYYALRAKCILLAEQSGQVRFKLPESLNLWGTCYALRARCSLLQQTYSSCIWSHPRGAFFTLLEHYGVISYKVKKSSQILFHLKAFHLYHNFYFSLLYNSFWSSLYSFCKIKIAQNHYHQ